jgi:hypothetical protein
MRWVIALFLALFAIPVAQVAADAWNGRPGPRLSVMPSHARSGEGAWPDLAATRHRQYRFYDPLAPVLPGRAKAG